MVSRWKRLFGRLVRALIAVLRFRRSQRATPPESPVEAGDPDDPHVEIAIYQTAALTKRNGRAPEQTVARYAAEALSRAGLAATVHFGYGPKDPPKESSFDPDNVDWWRKEPKEYIAQDCNLLIFDTKGGGRGGEVYQLGPGRHIDRVLPIKDVARGKAYRNTRGNIHEIGHGLSGKHSDNMMSPPRMWYNESTIDDFFENVQAVEESDDRHP